MAILAIDLGGTKLATALFSEKGKVLSGNVTPLDKRVGEEVGLLILDQIKSYTRAQRSSIAAIGVSVPGISRSERGTVWAPNIPGWDDYPLLDQIKSVSAGIPVCIDSDRACSILGERWQGNARDAKDAIFLSVGTGIGAGILADGIVLRGAHDIAGAIGWMALKKPYERKYDACGCFEYYASGEGIARLAMEMLESEKNYNGPLSVLHPDALTAHHIFEAYDNHDVIAVKTIAECIEFWGMAVANLVSIFNPEKIIFGGGVFGPAIKFIPAIQQEAAKWAQPISMKQVTFHHAALGSEAAMYGAGFLAVKKTEP